MDYTFHYSPFDYIYSAIQEGGVDYGKKIAELKDDQIKFHKISNKMNNTNFTISHIAEYEYFMFGFDSSMNMGHTKNELEQMFDVTCAHEILIDNNYMNSIYKLNTDNSKSDVNVDLHNYWNNILKSLYKHELFDILETFKYVLINYSDDTNTQIKEKLICESGGVNIINV